MTGYFISITLLIAVILIIRRIFRNKISPRVLYGLWLAVIIRFCLPFSLFSVPVEITLPETSAFPAESAEISVSEIQTPVEEPMTGVFRTDKYPAFPDSVTGKTDLPVWEYHPETLPTAEDHIEETLPFPAFDVGDGHEAVPERTPDETPVTKPVRHLNLRGVLLTVWAVGMAVFTLWFSFSWLNFRIRIRQSRKYLSDYRNVRVFSSPEAGVPCLFGLFPSIYVLPESAEQSDYPLILKHEYTHFRHGDHFWGILRIVILIVFWWNPLIWLAAIRSKQDAELAVDDSVVTALSEEERIRYARSILDHSPVVRNPLEKAAAHFGGSPIKIRILAITERKKKRFAKLFSAAVLLLVTASLVISTFTITVVGKAPEPDLSEDDPSDASTEDSTDEIADATAPDESETVPEETTAEAVRREAFPDRSVINTNSGKKAEKLPDNVIPIDPTLIATGKTGDCDWTLRKSGCMYISGQGSMGDYNYYVKVPWQPLSDLITSVVIDEGVTRVGKCSFSGCSNLREVSISSSVITVDDYAFSQCPSLTTVVMKNGVRDIRNCTFSYCYSLWNIQFPDSLIYIGVEAFKYSGVVELNLPRNLQTIDGWAFADCQSLRNVSMQDCVTSIGDHVFYECTALQSVSFSKTLKSVGDYAFSKSGVANIKFPSSLKSFGHWVFEDCPNLESYSRPVLPGDEKELEKLNPKNSDPRPELPSLNIWDPYPKMPGFSYPNANSGTIYNPFP